MIPQDNIVAILVVAATLYLAWYFWRRRRRKAGCASCKLMQAADRPQADVQETADKSH